MEEKDDNSDKEIYKIVKLQTPENVSHIRAYKWVNFNSVMSIDIDAISVKQYPQRLEAVL